MEDESEYRLEDLQLVEIQELLEESGIELCEAEVRELAQFVKEVGGLDEALETLAQLQSRQEAA